MFDLGIVATTVGVACPGARKVQVVEMRSGELGLVYPSGKIEWLPPNLRK